MTQPLTRRTTGAGPARRPGAQTRRTPMPALLILGALAATGPAPPAQAESLLTDLSAHLVAVRSDFTGAQILLFGAITPDGGETTADGVRDVVVVVRGPALPVVVHRKARVAGIWVNYESVTFNNAPGYYAVASTRPLDVLDAPGVLQRHAIGLDSLAITPAQVRMIGASARPALVAAQFETYRQAVIRHNVAEGLYRTEPGAVTFLGDTLFRTTLDLPANVPAGSYTAEVYLLRGGAVIDAQTSPLYVDRTGFSRVLFRFARGTPLLYGIAAVLMALAAGWLGSAIFRRLW